MRGVLGLPKVFGLAPHGLLMVVANGLKRLIWSYPHGHNLIPVSRAEEEMTRFGVTAIIRLFRLSPCN